MGIRCSPRRLAARLFGLAALLLAFGARAGVPDPEPDPEIEAFIAREMPASGAPGLAYAIVAEDAIVQVGARGVMKLGEVEKVSPDTPFASGSISKSFTALAIMQLVEAEQVDLDAALSLYLDEFAGQPGGEVTIRQLLSHTSGFSTFQGNVSHPELPDELARTVEQSARVVPVAPPGTLWAYSNLNYQILGRVIEVVSGEDYASYLESRILRPVGMTHSFVADGEIHEEMATGHRPWFGRKRPRPEAKTQRSSAPQGGVISSARDLALYLQVMMNGEDDILSAEGKAAMMRPASDASPFYGLGWFVDQERGSVWHSGSTPGVETLATMLPDERKAVVVLVNAGSGVGFGEMSELLQGTMARALDIPLEPHDSRWAQKLLFVALTLAPFIYLFATFWAWRHRSTLRARSGAAGLFSLWFPLLTTFAAAVFIFGLMPRLFGVPLEGLRQFQPDLALVLIATAIAGVAWALSRLGLAYTRTAA